MVFPPGHREAFRAVQDEFGSDHAGAIFHRNHVLTHGLFFSRHRIKNSWD
jgi:hypothetical protein